MMCRVKCVGMHVFAFCFVVCMLPFFMGGSLLLCCVSAACVWCVCFVMCSLFCFVCVCFDCVGLCCFCVAVC